MPCLGDFDLIWSSHFAGSGADAYVRDVAVPSAGRPMLAHETLGAMSPWNIGEAVTTDGSRILLAGKVAVPGYVDPVEALAVLRLDSGGTLDTTSDSDGWALAVISYLGSPTTATAAAMERTPAGGSVVAGFTCKILSPNAPAAVVARFTAAGALVKLVPTDLCSSHFAHGTAGHWCR